MRKISSTILVLAVWAGCLALAANHPIDFSGEWFQEKTDRGTTMRDVVRHLPGGSYPGGGYPGGGYPGGGYPGGGYPGGGYPSGGGRRGGGYPGGGHPGGRNPHEAKSLILTISQTPEILTVTHKWTDLDGKNDQETVQTFTFDGKENDNPADIGSGRLKSTTHWNKKKLVVEGKQQMTRGDENIEVHLKKVFYLSGDGKKLTIKTTRSTAQGERSFKQTFKKL